MIPYLRRIQAQAFQKKNSILVPGHGIRFFRSDIAEEAGPAVNIAEIDSFHAVQDLFPGFGFQIAELIKAFALVVSIGLAEALFTDGDAVFIHELIYVIKFQIEFCHGSPVIGGGPVVNGIEVPAVRGLVMDFDPGGPGIVKIAFLGVADNGAKAVQAFI